MSWAGGLQILAVFLLICNLFEPITAYSIEKLIWDRLSKKSGGVFTPGSGKSPINVTLSVGLSSVSDYDPTLGTMKLGYWMRLRWIDPDLTWQSNGYRGVDIIRVPSRKLWVPDILPFRHTDTRQTSEEQAIIRSNGQVQWSPHIITSVFCEDVPDGPRFPRDHKNCNVNLGSWMYNEQVVNLTTEAELSQSSLLKDFSVAPLRSSGWEFVNATERLKITRYPCCIERFPSIVISVIIRRADTYFAMAVSVPGVISGLLVSLLYLLTPTSSSRVISQTICLLILVLVAVMDLRLMESSVKMAPAAHYFMAAMVLDLLAIVWSIVMATVWTQASASTSCSNQTLTSILNKLERICLLPPVATETDTQELQAEDDKEATSRRPACLTSAQRLCLALDRLLCLLNLLLFALLFVYLAA